MGRCSPAYVFSCEIRLSSAAITCVSRSARSGRPISRSSGTCLRRSSATLLMPVIHESVVSAETLRARAPLIFFSALAPAVSPFATAASHAAVLAFRDGWTGCALLLSTVITTWSGKLLSRAARLRSGSGALASRSGALLGPVSACRSLAVATSCASATGCRGVTCASLSRL